MNETRVGERTEPTLDGIMTVCDGRPVFATPVCARIFGFDSVSEFLGIRDVAELIAPCHHSRLAALMTRTLAGTAEPFAIDLLGLKPDGSTVMVAARSLPARWNGGDAVQISVHGSLPDSIADRQEVEALQRLASAVAHDLNNFLLPIVLAADLTREDNPTGDKLRANMDRILHAAGSARDLTEALRRYSSLQPTDIRPVSLGDLLDSVVGEMRAQAPAGIDISASHRVAAVSVEGDVGQIRELVTQVICNAVEALGDRPGTVRVELDRSDGGQGDKASRPRFARITVRDDGPGLDAKTLARAFEPLFTTRKDGHAKGLGLAVARAIACGHRGDISIANAPDGGASTTVLLPISGDAADR